MKIRIRFSNTLLYNHIYFFTIINYKIDNYIRIIFFYSIFIPVQTFIEIIYIKKIDKLEITIFYNMNSILEVNSPFLLVNLAMNVYLTIYFFNRLFYRYIYVENMDPHYVYSKYLRNSFLFQIIYYF
jgi:hypothetical protein